MKEYYDNMWQQEKPFGFWTNSNFQYHYDFFKPYTKTPLLDYGCGSGDFLDKISDVGFGYDISEVAIEKARKKYPQKFFYTSTSDFKKHAFETICLIDVLEHVPDLNTMLQEIKRIIRPGGHLLIATNELSPIKAALICLVIFEKYFSPTSPHLRYFTRNTLAEVLEANGFKIIRYKRNKSYLGVFSRGQLVVAKSK
jgi:2-polyprenyl-3-methyl-5-hydroxy-6-metoxy-1,4-benzoquinol methylase